MSHPSIWPPGPRLDPTFPEALAQHSARRATGTVDQLLVLADRWRAAPAVVSVIEVSLVNSAVMERRLEVLEALAVEARTQVVRDTATAAAGGVYVDALREFGIGTGGTRDFDLGTDWLRRARLWIDRPGGRNDPVEARVDALRGEILRVQTRLHDDEGRSLAVALGAPFRAAPTSLAQWDDYRLHLEARARAWMRTERARNITSPSASELRAAL